VALDLRVIAGVAGIGAVALFGTARWMLYLQQGCLFWCVMLPV